MKRKITIAAIVIFFFIVPFQLTYAAPTAEQVDQLLAELEWTNNDLTEYLDYYEFTLADFETIADLRDFLGTPITEENVAMLLNAYGMSQSELDELLAGFGESVADYTFIEELEYAVDFYLNHDSELKEVEEFLAQVGLTEAEVDLLFTHLMSLDPENLETKMEQLFTSMEPYLLLEDTSELAEEEQRELIRLWDEMISAYQLKPSFSLIKNDVKTPIAFADLMEMDELNGNGLFVELYTNDGKMILDMAFSPEMLASSFVLETGEELAHVGDMAGELTNVLHEQRLPNTASPYLVQAGFGVLLLIIGLILFTFTRRRAFV